MRFPPTLTRRINEARYRHARRRGDVRGRKRVRVSLSSRHGEDRCGAREKSDVNGGADGRRQEISRRRRSAAQGRQASGIDRYACQGDENPERLLNTSRALPATAERTPRPFAWRFSFTGRRAFGGRWRGRSRREAKLRT